MTTIVFIHFLSSHFKIQKNYKLFFNNFLSGVSLVILKLAMLKTKFVF
jgi:hypothetical protein